jgi:hypothetical protein
MFYNFNEFNFHIFIYIYTYIYEKKHRQPTYTNYIYVCLSVYLVYHTNLQPSTSVLTSPNSLLLKSPPLYLCQFLLQFYV